MPKASFIGLTHPLPPLGLASPNAAYRLSRSAPLLSAKGAAHPIPGQRPGMAWWFQQPIRWHAPSGLESFSIPYPGRCPGLSCHASSGLMMKGFAQSLVRFCLSGQRPELSQPRATPWVTEEQMTSPVGATHPTPPHCPAPSWLIYEGAWVLGQWPQAEWAWAGWHVVRLLSQVALALAGGGRAVGGGLA